MSIEALAHTGCRGATFGVAPGPEAPEISTVLFLADGRFHLEASMIQNPGIRFIRYDPFTKVNLKSFTSSVPSSRGQDPHFGGPSLTCCTKKQCTS